MAMNFETGSGNEQERKQPEIMKTPEIVSEAEWGAQLCSLLFRAENPDWEGGGDGLLAQEADAYFDTHPLSSDIRDALRRLFDEYGADEESLYNLALAHDHPERLQAVARMIAEHKPNIKNLQKVQEIFFDVLESFGGSFSGSELAAKLRGFLDEDKEKRMDNIDETSRRLGGVIDFFQPNSGTTPINRINFVPTDPIRRKNSGFAAFFGKEQVIVSHIDNVDNQEHEFLHGIINPIVDKLAAQLTDEQKEKTSKQANDILKKDYGEDWQSLLCEELIRSYNDIFRRGGTDSIRSNFQKKLSGLDGEGFGRLVSENGALRNACIVLGIAGVEDAKIRVEDLFNALVKRSPLGDILISMYQEYSDRNDQTVNFEQFFLENFASRL